jgi:hypothetical protein
MTLMLYLNEHELGFDANCIGFPSISGCHAIVAVTGNGLFGFHNAGGSAPDAYAPRATAFAEYLTSHDQSGKVLRLYGACHRASRRGYFGGGSWQGEMTAFADALGYTGKISGYDLSKQDYKDPHLPGLTKEESSYVEYQFAGSKCGIYYKRWGKVTARKGDLAVGVSLRRMQRQAPGVYGLYDQNLKVTTSVALDPAKTKSNEGKLHKVGSLAMKSFNYRGRAAD